MKIFSILIAAIIVIALGVVGIAHSGLVSVAASEPHNAIVHWFLTTTSHSYVERHAADIEVPPLNDESLKLAGVNDFDAMCSGCHGAPGKDRGALGKGLNPQAPDLAESAGHMTPAELFWVTKNGIRMTGMPAWGSTHDDEALWSIVAFVSTLPDVDAAGYRELMSRAAGMGHHGAGGHRHPDGDDDDDHDAAAHDHEHDASMPDSHEDADDDDHDRDKSMPDSGEDAHDDAHDHTH